MGAIKNAGAIVGGFVFLLVRGILLWFFLIPSIVPWLIGLVLWPLLRPFGLRIPVSQLYYSRWTTYLLDGMLTRVSPYPSSPWPWQVDVRNSKIQSWGMAADFST